MQQYVLKVVSWIEFPPAELIKVAWKFSNPAHPLQFPLHVTPDSPHRVGMCACFLIHGHVVVLGAAVEVHIWGKLVC